MPHPSRLVDDIRAPSYNREHGRFAAVSRTFGSRRVRALLAAVDPRASAESVRLIDTFRSYSLYSFPQCYCSEILLHKSSLFAMTVLKNFSQESSAIAL